jgi:hypothetical protein
MCKIRSYLTDIATAMALTALATAAAAADKPPAADSDPTFGSRTDKPDGSAAMTIGRRLPTPWETKIGTDVSLAAPPVTTTSDYLMRGAAHDRSSGALWGSMTVPGVRPLGFDKTSVEARIDAGSDEGRLGAAVSRSVPIGSGLAVTLQNTTSIKQSLATAAPPLPAAGGSAAAGTPVPSWGMDDTVRLSVDPFGTTISAGAAGSGGDSQWTSKLSLEQTVVGPLKLTTSVEGAGTATPTKSITAGFKRTW